jgi:hypothetical protein
MGASGTQVSVEPTASGKWQVVTNGVGGRTYNYKDQAVKAGRRKAKKNGGTLKILKQNRTIQATHSY